MKIRFLGVGTQFSGHDQYHSNMVITAHSGKRLLIDCGSDAKFSLAESNLRPTDLDAVYISHLHADHIGGLEWLALSTYFSPEHKRLALFCEEQLQNKLWDNSLKGGLECLGERCMHLDDYFDPRPLRGEGEFLWEGIKFNLIKMPHVGGECCQSVSFGLLAEDTHNMGPSVFFTTDTVFQPGLLETLSEKVDLIFHDCETSANKTTVHAHYDQLCTLSASVKRKIWLYHYQPNSQYNPQKDRFQGFVVKGQEFSCHSEFTGKSRKAETMKA